MLYDPKWEIKADPFSLEGLIAWLETMPADREYEFMDCDGACLLGQYMAHVKEPWSMDGYIQIARHMLNGHHGLTFSVGARFPRTFGAALKRALAANTAGK